MPDSPHPLPAHLLLHHMAPPPPPRSLLTSIDVLCAGRYVFSASSDNTIIPWASRSLRASGGLVSMSSAPLTSIAAGEQTLVLGSGDGTVQVSVKGRQRPSIPQSQSSRACL